MPCLFHLILYLGDDSISVLEEILNFYVFYFLRLNRTSFFESIIMYLANPLLVNSEVDVKLTLLQILTQ